MRLFSEVFEKSVTITIVDTIVNGGAAVRVVKFTSICTAFTYKDKKQYAKIYRDRVLRGNR